MVVGDLIGEGSPQEQSVVGETPNLAARLQALAEPDAVVIASGTRQLVGDLFEYRDLGAVEVKGIAVSRLPEDELQDSLARLAASEPVFQRGRPPDAVYRYKHALVQDAAHGSLLRNARQQLHAQIVEALDTQSPELMDSQPELFAQH